MHLLVRETRSLDEAAPAVDLAHAPAEIVVLSFSDADLGAVAPPRAASRCAPGEPGPAAASAVGRPVSGTDHRRMHAAWCIRLLGGLDYWRYGAEEAGRAVPGAAASRWRCCPATAATTRRWLALSTVAPSAYARLDPLFPPGRGRPTWRARCVIAAHLAGLAAG